MKLSEQKLRKVIRNEIKSVLKEEYIELFLMNRDFENAIDDIVDAYVEWKNGPAWEGRGPSTSQKVEAKDEILNHITRRLRKVM